VQRYDATFFNYVGKSLSDPLGMRVEICRNTPVGVVSVIAARADSDNRSTSIARSAELTHRLPRQGTSAR
jgi:hypothetical protein